MKIERRKKMKTYDVKITKKKVKNNYPQDNL